MADDAKNITNEELEKALEGANELAAELGELSSNQTLEDVNGIIALKRAIWKNRQDILKILIKNGLDINKTDKYNNNALIVALDNDNSEIAKILIENNVEYEFEKVKFD